MPDDQAIADAQAARLTLTSNAPALSTTTDMPQGKPATTREEVSSEARAKAAAPSPAPATSPAPAPGVTPESKAAPAPTPAPATSGGEDETPGWLKAKLSKTEAEAEEKVQAARREADAARAERDAALARLKPAEEAKPAEIVRPNRDDYDDPDKYEDALIEYGDKRAEATRVKKEREDREHADRRALEERVVNTRRAYGDSRAKAIADRYADFATVAESPTLPVTPLMADTLMQSALGPDILYFLGKNPAESERISKLDGMAQVKEIGKIEAKLEAAGLGGASASPAPAPSPSPAPAPARSVTGAPPPAKPVGSRDTATADESSMSMDDYARAQKAKGRNFRVGT